MNENEYQRAEAFALTRWRLPSEHFSHGEDWRSSDRAMLGAFYGGLVKASEHNWQNGGRVLVDRTDIRILFESYRLPLPIRPLDQCCRQLDRFVREVMFANWSQLLVAENDSEYGVAPGQAHPGGENRLIERQKRRQNLVTEWEQEVAIDIFCGDEHLQGARTLLFFLCPTLPFYPGSINTTDKHLASGGRFERFFDESNAVAENEKPAGSVIRRVLSQSDWWSRRVFWALEQI